MARTGHRRHTSRLGMLLVGITLGELGVLQFLRGYLDIPWSELWPLSLVVPGLVMVIGAVSKQPAQDEDRGLSHQQRFH